MLYPNATWWRCTHQNKSRNSFIQGLLFKNLQKIISNSAPCWLKHHCEISLKKIHQLRNTVTNRTTWTDICNESVMKNNCRMVLVVVFFFFLFSFSQWKHLLSGASPLVKCFYFPKNDTVSSLPAPPDSSSLKRELDTGNKHSNEGSTVRNNHSVQISEKKKFIYPYSTYFDIQQPNNTG